MTRAVRVYGEGREEGDRKEGGESPPQRDDDYRPVFSFAIAESVQGKIALDRNNSWRYKPE